MIEYVAAALVFLVLAGLLWGLIKKLASTAVVFIMNGIVGVLVLLFLNNYMDWAIPVNTPTLVVCGLFGIPGVGALIVLHLTGMI
jgi:pro-sigmaK processing inhibitor BofA